MSEIPLPDPDQDYYLRRMQQIFELHFIDSEHDRHGRLSDLTLGDLYADIEPMPSFEWQKTMPEVLHPYWATYDVALGMRQISTSELILMDNTYLDRIKQRKELIQQFPDLVIGAEPDADTAVKETYSWLTSTYLPSRYPTMFRLTEEGGLPKGIRNLVDGEVYPLEPPESTVQALGYIGSMVDEDLLFMLPSTDGDGYMLSAFVNCFANGPSTKDRMHKKLRDIHGSVPGYPFQLGSLVDRWFHQVKAGRTVKRENWAITDDARMFVPEGHVPFANALKEGSNTGRSLYVRSERQTLRRLQYSKAIVFSLKTYIYPLETIKAAGHGPQLLQAMDGLGRGNAPGMVQYKQLSAWEEQVRAYLKE
ncbi:hypothetical protein F5Y10DRAFT_230847 [Nemania abortiva]|nr:hypothetical protein F5Y10DRAFT_230847 [Nemania abortiva]